MQEKGLARRAIWIIAAAAIAAVGFYLFGGSDTNGVATGPEPTGSAIVSVKLPAELSPKAQLGETAYNAKCAACHGTNAEGQKSVAPPLVHKIYEPSHHADMAFVLAAQNGVRAHHWTFGNMPPVEGLTRADVLNIVAYVRELQRENGIR